MRRDGGDEHLDRLLRAVRDHWGENLGSEKCVVAEVFDPDVRVVTRTLMAAKAVCAATSARLAVLGDEDARRLGEVFGAARDGRPETSPIALVTARVDRNVPRDIPVVHVHGTGTMQAYALFPGEGPISFHDELPGRVAAFFEDHIWANRGLLGPGAERVAHQVKSGYQVRTDTERRQLRGHGCARLGLEPALPTIVVSGHTSGEDTKLFEKTVQFATSDELANWLFVDPVPAVHARIKHVGETLSTNILWSMADVGVVFGDSELPAFGIPVIQAGWSEGRDCGATHVAHSVPELRELLEEAVARHTRGETLLGPEQRERARLWLWLRHCGADVPSQLLPHWAHGDDYARVLAVNLRYVERDGDPLFTAVHRMWARREPLLTRFDFRNPTGLSTTITLGRGTR
jgi:hypothetical protein